MLVNVEVKRAVYNSYPYIYLHCRSPPSPPLVPCLALTPLYTLMLLKDLNLRTRSMIRCSGPPPSSSSRLLRLDRFSRSIRLCSISRNLVVHFGGIGISLGLQNRIKKIMEASLLILLYLMDSR